MGHTHINKHKWKHSCHTFLYSFLKSVSLAGCIYTYHTVVCVCVWGGIFTFKGDYTVEYL